MATRKRSRKKRTYTLTFSLPGRLTFRRPKMNPKRKAVIRRFVKFAAFGVLGSFLAVAGFAAMQALTDSEFPSWLVTMVGITVSGIAASIQKAVNWNAVGMDAPAIPTVSTDGIAITPPTGDTR